MIEENNSYKYLVIEDYETIVNQLIEAKQEFCEDIRHSTQDMKVNWKV